MKRGPVFEIVFSRLEDGHSTAMLNRAEIPQHAAIFVRVGNT